MGWVATVATRPLFPCWKSPPPPDIGSWVGTSAGSNALDDWQNLLCLVNWNTAPWRPTRGLVSVPAKTSSLIKAGGGREKSELRAEKERVPFHCRCVSQQQLASRHRQSSNWLAATSQCIVTAALVTAVWQQLLWLTFFVDLNFTYNITSLESHTALRQLVATVIAAPPNWLLTSHRNRPNSDFIQYWVTWNDAEFRVTVIKSLLSIHRSSLVRTWWRRAKCLFRPAIEPVVLLPLLPQHVGELTESASLKVQVTNTVTIRIIVTICAILLLTPSVCLAVQRV